MEILGYILASLIGISLGLIGSGGSILTVPLLVYVFNISPVLATAYSLFIVGAASLVGSAKKIVNKEIKLKTVLFFGLPSILAVYSTRKFIIPSLPKVFFEIGNFEVTKDLFIMLLFAVFMAIAAIVMIKDPKDGKEDNGNNTKKKVNYGIIVLEGLLVGTLTGFVGAGGGFMIIPVLVLMVGMPMKEAIGTSLAIIAIKSMIGFVGDVQNFASEIDWSFLLIVTGISIAGIFVGIYLGRFIPAKSLKKGFGWFVLLMSIFILFKELG